MNITFIGLGKMGSAMAEKLVEAGHSLTVFNRSREKALPFEKKGCKIAPTLEIAAQDADVIFSSVLDDKALNQVVDICLPHFKKNAIHVSTSTILPKTALAQSEKHQAQGHIYLAAPVLGIPQAVKAKEAMTICAGDQAAIEKVSPLFQAYSASIQNMGPHAPHANTFKICLNYSLITTIELISELYAFAEKSDFEKEIIKGALKHIYALPPFHVYIDKIFDRNFDQVNFGMEGGNKDVNLFQQAFKDVGVVPDIANLIGGKFTEAMATGLADKDWSAVSEVTRRRSGLK